MGKGRKMIQALIPSKYDPFMNFLADPEERLKAGISNKNEMLFAFTKSTEFATLGWHDMNYVCNNAGVKMNNSTQMRHTASTLL